MWKSSLALLSALAQSGCPFFRALGEVPALQTFLNGTEALVPLMHATRATEIPREIKNYAKAELILARRRGCMAALKTGPRGLEKCTAIN